MPDLWILNVKQLNINFHFIKDYPEYIQNALINKFVKINSDLFQAETDPFRYFSKKISSNVNMIKMNIIKYFPNLTNINIHCGYRDQKYRFNIIGFIELLPKSNVGCFDDNTYENDSIFDFCLI